MDDPQFIVGGATRTDICQGALGESLFFEFPMKNNSKTQLHRCWICSLTGRRLLALSGHRLSDPEWEAPSSGCSTRPVLPGRLRWNLPLPGSLRHFPLFSPLSPPGWWSPWLLPCVAVLAVWWLDRCCDWWSTARQRRGANVCPFSWRQWILECTLGESLRQVRIKSACLADTLFSGNVFCGKPYYDGLLSWAVILKPVLHVLLGWTALMRLYLGEAPQKGLKTLQVGCLRCMSCAKLREICIG